MRTQVMRYEGEGVHPRSLHIHLWQLLICILERGVSEVLDVVRTKSWPGGAVTWLPLPPSGIPAICISQRHWESPLYPRLIPLAFKRFTEGSSLPPSCTLTLTSKTLFLKPHFNLSAQKCQLTFSFADNPKQLTRWHSKAYRSRSYHICKLWGKKKKKKISFWYLFSKTFLSKSLCSLLLSFKLTLELHDSA